MGRKREYGRGWDVVCERLIFVEDFCLTNLKTSILVHEAAACTHVEAREMKERKRFSISTSKRLLGAGSHRQWSESNKRLGKEHKSIKSVRDLCRVPRAG